MECLNIRALANSYPNKKNFSEFARMITGQRFQPLFRDHPGELGRGLITKKITRREGLTIDEGRGTTRKIEQSFYPFSHLLFFVVNNFFIIKDLAGLSTRG